LRRAATSIPLNIVEGFGRKTVADFKHFLRNSVGSCNEVTVIVEILRDLGYIEEELYRQILSQYEIVGKQLTTLIKEWK